MRTSRETVYDAIDTERNYQDKRWLGHKHSATEYVVYIDHYVKKAMAAASTDDNDTNVIENLRKIAALAVAAMEENGTIPRYS